MRQFLPSRDTSNKVTLLGSLYLDRIFLISRTPQNYPDALYTLGECYYDGIADIVEQDYSEAFTLYEKSAKLGNALARQQLGRM